MMPFVEVASVMRLLERDEELRQLDAVVDECVVGRGRVVLIEGPPGIGKTQLLEETRTRARERGAAVLSARASELDRDFPFGVVRQLFESLVASSDRALLDGAAALSAPLFDVPPADAGRA